MEIGEGSERGLCASMPADGGGDPTVTTSGRRMAAGGATQTMTKVGGAVDGVIVVAEVGEIEAQEASVQLSPLQNPKQIPRESPTPPSSGEPAGGIKKIAGDSFRTICSANDVGLQSTPAVLKTRAQSPVLDADGLDEERGEDDEIATTAAVRNASKSNGIPTGHAIADLDNDPDTTGAPWVSGTYGLLTPKAEDVSVSHEYSDRSLGLRSGYYGVFDGHGGSGAAKMASRLLHDMIIHELKSEARASQKRLEDVSYVSNDTFTRACNELDSMTKLATSAGTTASVLFTRKLHSGDTTLSAAWVGDSRMIFIHGTSGQVMRMTEDHSTHNANELTRVSEHAPDEFVEDLPVIHSAHINYRATPGSQTGMRRSNSVGRFRDERTGELVGPLRLFAPNGASTVVTRSIGDRDIASAVISDPQCFHEVVPEDETLTVVICSDGVWDVMSNEDVALIVNGISKPESMAKKIAFRAATLRRSKGMRMDDITVTCIIVHPDVPRFRTGNTSCCTTM